jgi:GT2 family glycosyltransferase
VSRPLVSVLTPTWQRPELLRGCIENVRASTYRPLEHVIVSDGLDEDAVELSRDQLGVQDWDDRRVPIWFVELGRNWSSFLPDAYAAAPMTVAMLLARGAYQCWLADDERMAPDHVELLVELLERELADFAYSRVQMYRADGSSWVIGRYPPALGEITHALYRAEVLKLGLYVFGDDRTSDWATISRWQSRGAKAAYLDRVTMTHRVDR